jgi:hypothetical protein
MRSRVFSCAAAWVPCVHLDHRHVESFFFIIPDAADLRPSMLLCAHFDESIYLLARQSERQSKAELWQNVAQVARVTRAAANVFCFVLKGCKLQGQARGAGTHIHRRKRREVASSDTR